MEKLLKEKFSGNYVLGLEIEIVVHILCENGKR